MTTALLPFEGVQEPAAPPEWGRQLDDWQRLLRRCAQKPSRRRVHELRVATLRLQLQLDHWQEGHEPGADAARAVARWLRQADRLREVLGKVREADVFLAKVDRLRCAAEDDGIEPSCDPASLRQLRVLERRLQRRRESAAGKLAAHIEGRLDRLAGMSRDLETALAAVPGQDNRFTAETVVGLFAGLAGEFPELNEENLHEFRMRIKKIRYLNDLFAPVDEAASRQAAALGRMQTALGEWHDWTLLAEKAPRLLGARAEIGSLETVLDDLAASSLRRALTICRRVTARVLRHSAEPENQAPAARKPLRRIVPVVRARRAQSA